jgi:hypothetical protein
MCLDVRLERDTVWLTQAQMVELFGRDQSVISRHVRNVFADGELPAESNMQKMHIPSSDKPVVYYSLDVIISVGYRVKSLRGTQFRIWATRTVKEETFKGWELVQATARLCCHWAPSERVINSGNCDGRMDAARIARTANRTACRTALATSGRPMRLPSWPNVAFPVHGWNGCCAIPNGPGRTSVTGNCDTPSVGLPRMMTGYCG